MKLELTAMGAVIGFLAGLGAIRHLTFEAAGSWAFEHRAIVVLALCALFLIVACLRFVSISTRPYRRAR